nr:hypothetical protein [uncultured Flavobacterium sp.]
MRKITLIFFLLITLTSFSQNKYYRVDISDGRSSLYTMNQFNNLIQDGYRFVYGQIDYEKITNREQKLVVISQVLISGLFVSPITHEEGHRSVLTEENIGSINLPFITSKGVAEVTGVTDATLQSLRDTKLPTYIRLHNGGLESDYDYLKKEDALFNFREEDYTVLYVDYLIRKLGVSIYYLTTLFHNKSGINESDDEELKRDIVGHDIFGMIRHLHRPEMEFKRYTEWNDLTATEKTYGKRIGFLSLLNYANPNIWKIKSYKLSENTNGNFSLNYSLAPFGDFIEQNVYLDIQKRWKINPFVREYFNENTVFLCSGINLDNYILNKNFLINGSLEVWQQPKDLSFTSSQADLGMGIKTELAYRLINIKNSDVFFNLGLNYKTKGFIPASPSLENDFRINFGLIIASTKLKI